MRTPAAADAIRAMVKAAPEAYVGAGTLLRSEDVTRAVDAGAAFGVASGMTSSLAKAVLAAGLPFLPGVSSASEVMKAMEFGFSTLKLFPAQGAGVAWLQAMAGVFPSVTFCPTGGTGPGDVPTIRRCPTVVPSAARGSPPAISSRRTIGPPSRRWLPRSPRSSRRKRRLLPCLCTAANA